MKKRQMITIVLVLSILACALSSCSSAEKSSGSSNDTGNKTASATTEKISEKNDTTEQSTETEPDNIVLSGDLDNISWKLSSDDTLYIYGTGSTPYDLYQKFGEVVNIVVGDGITEISSILFNEFKELESITISGTVERLTNDINPKLIPFNDCPKLKTINISEDNPYYSSDDGVLFNKTKTELIKYPIGKENTEYEIPDGTKAIAKHAFAKNSYLEGINIPDSINEISDAAFAECSSLVSASLPDSVNEISYDLFRECSSLKNVVIPDSITVIRGYAFIDCVELNDLLIPEKVQEIEGYAFRNCSSLKNVNVPDSVEELGQGVFADCSGLDYAVIGKNVKELSYTFDNSGIIGVTFNGKTKLGSKVFNDCKNLKWLELSKDGISFEPLEILYLFEGSEYPEIYYNGTEEEFNSLDKQERTYINIIAGSPNPKIFINSTAPDQD